MMMIGDAVDIGAAMGARSAAASAESADVVLLVENFDRLLPGIEIAQRSRRIAVEGVAAGFGLSVLGLLAACAGEPSMH